MPAPSPGVGFAAAGAAMVQVDQDGQGVADDLVRFLAFDIDDKAHAAGIVLELRVVKNPCLGGKPVRSS